MGDHSGSVIGGDGMPGVFEVRGIGRFEVHDPVWTLPESGEALIHDGDTVEFRGQMWRLYGFDAPETRLAADNGQDRALRKDVEDRRGGWAHCSEELALGERAMQRLKDLLEEAIPRGALTIQIMNVRPDAHHRRLVRFLIDGENVGDILQREGLAKPYNGVGKRPVHCSCKSHAQMRAEAAAAAEEAQFREQQRRFDLIRRRA